MYTLSSRLAICLALCMAVSVSWGAKICVDAGHGGTDPGAVGCGQQEAANVLNTCFKLRDWLNRDSSDGAGGGSWAVVMTRTTNVFVTLQGRCNIANNNGCDRFVCIHNNACGCGATGTETFCHTSLGTGGNLRNNIQARMLAAWGLANRGNKTATFYVLSNTAMPATLSELGFIDNCGRDAGFTGNAGQQDNAALAHLYGLQVHYGIGAYRPGSGYVVGGAIKVKYDSLGGAGGFLGAPITNELTCPDNVGKYNHFANGGSIYWTPSTGAWSIFGAIRNKWAALGWETGYCGYPTTDEMVCPDNVGRYNHFTGKNGSVASIYWTPAKGAWAIRGAIRTKWAALGWENGVCGYPVTDENTCPDNVGKYNHFTGKDPLGASIYWTPNTGAFETHGLIRQHWASLGWERSSVGYPTSDEYGVAEGRRQNFQNGTITYHAATGVCTVP